MRRIAAGAAALAFMMLGVSPAQAETTATIDQVEGADGELSIVVALDDVSTDNEVDERGVEATLDGVQLEVDVEPLSESNEVDQTAMLVMDTSDSMLKGGRLESAQAAAADFTAAVPSDVAIGLITFDDSASVLVDPTEDRTELLSAIDGLSTAPQTALYDAVVLASKELKKYELATAVVLSDGSDRGSDASFEEATQDARRSDARFDVVSYGTSTDQIAALSAIADATGGSLAKADDAVALEEVFTSIASTISNRYVVAAQIPEDFAADSGTVEVKFPVGDTIVTDSTFVTLPDLEEEALRDATAPKPAPPPGPLARVADELIWLAVAGLFIAMAVVVYFAISSATDREGRGNRGVKRRLSIYTLTSGTPVKEQETTVLGDTQVARSAVEFADRVVAQRDFESVLGARLDAAGLPLKPAEWLLIHVGAAIGSGFIFLLIFGGKLFPTILGLVLGLVIPWMYLSYKERKRKKAFMAGLPDTLQLMAGSLAAGYSMPQAVDTVVREGQAPISTEFNRALVETRLGVDLEDALDGIADRMGSVDFAWVVMAIRIQREVGGNLAEVLTTVAATLRERERLRRQVQVLSAEGRLSAWILGALPVVFALYLILVRPDYLAPMVNTLLGWLMLGTGLFLLIVGGFWLRKVVKVEV